MIPESGTPDELKECVLNLWCWMFLCGHRFVSSYTDMTSAETNNEVKTCPRCALKYSNRNSEDWIPTGRAGLDMGKL